MSSLAPRAKAREVAMAGRGKGEKKDSSEEKQEKEARRKKRMKKEERKRKEEEKKEGGGRGGRGGPPFPSRFVTTAPQVEVRHCAHTPYPCLDCVWLELAQVSCRLSQML